MLGIEKKREPKRQKGWRIAESLANYIEDQAKGLGRGAETEIIEDCIRLHKNLTKELSGQKVGLARYALDLGLDINSDEAGVISRLVLAGLEAHEAKAKKK